MAKRASTIIAPSQQIHDVLKRYNVKSPVYLLPTGVDPDIFKNPPEKVQEFRKTLDEKYPVLAGKRILLFAGRVGKEKNISFILKMMPAILLKET